MKLIMIECDAEELRADGCVGCAFESVEEWQDPCRRCKRGCEDYYRPKEGE